MWGQDGWILAKLLFLWTKTKSRSIKMHKKNKAILTKQAWSNKGFIIWPIITPKIFTFDGTKRVIHDNNTYRQQLICLHLFCSLFVYIGAPPTARLYGYMQCQRVSRRMLYTPTWIFQEWPPPTHPGNVSTILLPLVDSSYMVCLFPGV